MHVRSRINACFWWTLVCFCSLTLECEVIYHMKTACWSWFVSLATLHLKEEWKNTVAWLLQMCSDILIENTEELLLLLSSWPFHKQIKIICPHQQLHFIRSTWAWLWNVCHFILIHSKFKCEWFPSTAQYHLLYLNITVTGVYIYFIKCYDEIC